MQTHIDLPFADGTYTFKLGLKQINELQAKCNAGLGSIVARVLKGRYVLNDERFGNPLEGEWRHEDLIEVARQALIGGGKGEVDGLAVEVTAPLASRLIDNYLLDAPLSEKWDLAAAVLTALVEGYDPPKKDEPAAAPAAKTKAGSTTRRR